MRTVATYDLLFNTSAMVREGFGYVLGFEGLVYTGQRFVFPAVGTCVHIAHIHHLEKISGV